MSIDTAIIYGKANKSKYKLNLNTEKRRHKVNTGLSLKHGKPYKEKR